MYTMEEGEKAISVLESILDRYDYCLSTMACSMLLDEIVRDIEAFMMGLNKES